MKAVGLVERMAENLVEKKVDYWVVWLVGNLVAWKAFEWVVC
jgi:hypothetical protein